MRFSDLENAFQFAGMDGGYINEAWVSRSTGEVFLESDEAGIHELPDDVFPNDDLVQVPNRHELDLGQPLVWEFVDEQIPGLRSRVREIFSRRGAYGRYKDFLEGIGLLNVWYDFEDRKTREALLRWCEEEGIPVEK